MCESGTGKGLLKPTGKHFPVVDVKFEITHDFAETTGMNGSVVKQKRATVRCEAEETGRQLPLGDFDLVVGNEIIRLKHIAGHPEWLVLSSNA